jgi:Spy/CpxP family protein refolding chaperone
MKTLKTLLIIVTFVSTLHGQEMNRERKGGFGGTPMHREMHHLRFAKIILSEKCIATAKITPEQVTTLKKEFQQLDQKMVEINKQVIEASKKQAALSVMVLTTPGDDGQAMMKLTEDIGALRTQQAKLSVKVLMVIRDNLQPAQRASVVELMCEERQKMRSRHKTVRERTQLHPASE